LTRMAIVPLIVLGAVLAGCTSQLDTDKAEREIKKGIAEQTGVEVKSVECPDEVETEEGDTFECTAVAESGDEVSVKVTQTDDEGNVNWELDPDE